MNKREEKNKIYEEKYNSMVGLIFGNIKIIAYDKNGFNGKKYCFKAECLCGKEFYPLTKGVIDGRTKSCGCKRYEFIAAAKKLPNNYGLINRVHNSYRQHSLERNLDFFLTTENISNLIFNNCYYCGTIPLNTDNGGKKYIKPVPWNGIDRMNNDIGYILENCVTCCKICNIAKRNLGYIEYKEYIEKICIFNGYVKNII